MTVLVPILGDQLSPAISALRGADRADTVVLMMEVADETTYVRHHKQKLAYILSAMRHHAAALRETGWRVEYIALDDPDKAGSFTGELARAIQRHRPDRIVVTEAGEWRVAAMLDQWETLFGLPVEIRADDRFLVTHAEFAEWADRQRGRLVMEGFYREMRVKTGLLIAASPRAAAGTSTRITASLPTPGCSCLVRWPLPRMRSRARCWRWWPGASPTIPAASTGSIGG